MSELRCTDPRVGQLLPRYELGMLEDSEREAFLDHLAQCDFCHAELYALEPVTDLLRAKREAALAVRERASRAKRLLWPLHLLAHLERRRVAWAAAILIAASATLVAVLWSRGPEKPPEVTSTAPPQRPSPSGPKSSLSPQEIARLRSAETRTPFESALSAYEKGDFVRAIELLMPIVRLEPENAEAHFYLGASWLQLGRPQEAIGPLRRAVQLSVGVERERSRYHLALAYARAGQREEALRELEMLIAENSVYRRDAEQTKRQLLRSGMVK
ncbi:hypothetical protein HRbin08_01909 [bacterium HR08]|nr:hypothetical protein HRbin08_01909 [bacterium HR08]